MLIIALTQIPHFAEVANIYHVFSQIFWLLELSQIFRTPVHGFMAIHKSYVTRFVTYFTDNI